MMHLIYLILEIIYNTKSTDLFHFTALLKVNASIINMLAACHTSYSSLCHCRLRLCCTYVILLRCWLLFLGNVRAPRQPSLLERLFRLRRKDRARARREPRESFGKRRSLREPRADEFRV